MKDSNKSSQGAASQEPGSVPASGSQPRQTQSQQDQGTQGGKQQDGQANKGAQSDKPQQETMKDKRDSYSGGRSGND